MPKILSTSYLHSCLSYDKATGALTWRRRPRRHFKTDGAFKGWNTKFAGKPAGTRSDEYINIGMGGQRYRSHRIAWELATNSPPTDEIDHINGDTHDNRLDNLRMASRSANMRNRKIPIHNTSGRIGVTWDKSRRKWQAAISIGGKFKLLGRFADITDAIFARGKAEVLHGYHENHGRCRK